jgi:two-component system, NarL family, nitrate/nitrite response regulator NarL
MIVKSHEYFVMNFVALPGKLLSAPPPMPPEPVRRRTRILTGDAQPLFQDSLARALERRPSLELVSQVRDADALLAALEHARPDVALIDDSLLDPARVAALATRVVLLGGSPETARAFEALACGAAGYLSRDSDADALCDALVRVARGEAVLDPGLQTGVAREVRLRAGDRRPLLSPRERQILRLIANGSSAPRIARELNLSTCTVKTHMLHLYEKLGVSERAAAVAEAMRQGLLE